MAPFIHLRARVAVLGALLVLLQWLVPQASMAASMSGPIKLSTSDPYAKCSTGSSGSLNEEVYANGALGPSIAVNPQTVGTDHVNIIGVWEQDWWSTGAARGLVAASSFDGGTTWSQTELPFGACSVSGSSYQRVADPWISIGPDGTAYVLTLAITATNQNSIQVSTSHDAGKTWSSPTTLITDTSDAYFNTRGSVTADPTHAGVAYAVWSRNQQTRAGGEPAMLSITKDGGKTWSHPQAIAHSGQYAGTYGSSLLVDPKNGTLYDVFGWAIEQAKYQTLCHTVKVKGTGKNAGKTTTKKVCTKQRVVVDNPTFNYWTAFVKSTNGGTTWSAPKKIAKDVVVTNVDALSYRFATDDPAPTAAIDPTSGTLYVAWADGKATAGKLSGITWTSSSNSGSTWSTPSAAGPATTFGRFTPSLSVTSTGTVGLTYYEFTTGTGSDKPTAQYEWTSMTSGGSFTTEQAIGGPADLNSAPQAGGSADYLGGYMGLAAAGPAFDTLFVGTNDGNAANPSDVYAATITP